MQESRGHHTACALAQGANRSLQRFAGEVLDVSLALETDVRFEGRLSRQAQPPQALEPALKRCKTPSRSRRLCSRTLSSSAWACAPLCVGAPWPVEHLLAEPSETVFQNFLCAEVSASEPQKCPNRRGVVSAPEKRLRNGHLTRRAQELPGTWESSRLGGTASAYMPPLRPGSLLSIVITAPCGASLYPPQVQGVVRTSQATEKHH